jgi:hypothetical protein
VKGTEGEEEGERLRPASKMGLATSDSLTSEGSPEDSRSKEVRKRGGLLALALGTVRTCSRLTATTSAEGPVPAPLNEEDPRDTSFSQSPQCTFHPSWGPCKRVEKQQSSGPRTVQFQRRE